MNEYVGLILFQYNDDDDDNKDDDEDDDFAGADICWVLLSMYIENREKIEEDYKKLNWTSINRNTCSHTPP